MNRGMEMKVLCSKCGATFDSLIVDRKLALQELERKTIEHVSMHHKPEFAALAKGVQQVSIAMARLLHFGEFVVIPENEGWIIGNLEKLQEICMVALGFDPEDDTEEVEDNVVVMEPQAETVDLVSDPPEKA